MIQRRNAFVDGVHPVSPDGQIEMHIGLETVVDRHETSGAIYMFDMPRRPKVFTLWSDDALRAPHRCCISPTIRFGGFFLTSEGDYDARAGTGHAAMPLALPYENVSSG
jgi:hypothetical protein